MTKEEALKTWLPAIRSNIDDFSECQALDIATEALKKQKTGKWIRHDTGHSIYYDCSLCSCCAPCTETADKILWKLSNFCPDCGAKMENSQELWRTEE